MALALTILSALSLLSYDVAPELAESHNLAGAVGDALASVLLSAFGLAAWTVPLELGFVTLRLFRGSRAILGAATVAATLVFLLVGCALMHLAFSGGTWVEMPLAGGKLGEVIGEVLRALFGSVGAFVVGVTALLVTIVLRTPVSVVESAQRALRSARRGVDRARDGAGALVDAWQEARAIEEAEREQAEAAAAPKIIGEIEPTLDVDITGEVAFFDSAEDTLDADRERLAIDADDAAVTEEDGDDSAGEDEPSAEFHAPPPLKKGAAKGAAKAAPAAAANAPAKAAPDAPTIVPPREARPEVRERSKPAPSKEGFLIPDLSLLAEPNDAKIRVDPAQLRENAKRLVEKLESYGVKGRVDEIHPGPVVTMYEFEPKSGTKISKIAGLENDLALALAAQRVRIVAPIPGKARVGVDEGTNPRRQ